MWARGGGLSRSWDCLGRGALRRGLRGSPSEGPHALCAGGCEEHLNWRAGKAGSGCYYCRERERKRREEREREREEEKRERERIAGARAAAAGPAGKWEEGPGLQDPRRPRPRPLHQRRLNAPGTSQGKREPQAGHPTRAASSPDRQWPPLGPGALADAGSPNRYTPTFGAWLSRRDKLITGLSPWWEL